MLSAAVVVAVTLVGQSRIDPVLLVVRVAVLAALVLSLARPVFQVKAAPAAQVF